MDLTLPNAMPRARPPWRALAGALLSASLLLGGWLWLRDSSLVSASEVRISGVRGAGAAQVEQLLKATAERMTTMDFDARSLRAAVSGFPIVRDVRVHTSFPHEVRIEVLERSPVAALSADGQRTALAADGTALGPQLVTAALPALGGSFLPVPGQRVTDASAREALSAIAAAPPALARLVSRAFAGSEGLTLQMRNGLLVYFGDATRLHAKWLSLARVLADRSSAGARYVDVRVPERPAAGLASGASPGAPAGPSASPTATLAERLEQAYGGGSQSAASAQAGESPSGSEASPPHESSSPHEESPAGSQGQPTASTPAGETGAAEASSGGVSAGIGSSGKG